MGIENKDIIERLGGPKLFPAEQVEAEVSQMQENANSIDSLGGPSEPLTMTHGLLKRLQLNATATAREYWASKRKEPKLRGNELQERKKTTEKLRVIAVEWGKSMKYWRMKQQEFKKEFEQKSKEITSLEVAQKQNTTTEQELQKEEEALKDAPEEKKKEIVTKRLQLTKRKADRVQKIQKLKTEQRAIIDEAYFLQMNLETVERMYTLFLRFRTTLAAEDRYNSKEEGVQNQVKKWIALSEKYSKDWDAIRFHKQKISADKEKNKIAIANLKLLIDKLEGELSELEFVKKIKLSNIHPRFVWEPHQLYFIELEGKYKDETPKIWEGYSIIELEDPFEPGKVIDKYLQHYGRIPGKDEVYYNTIDEKDTNGKVIKRQLVLEIFYQPTYFQDAMVTFVIGDQRLKIHVESKSQEESRRKILESVIPSEEIEKKIPLPPPM